MLQCRAYGGAAGALHRCCEWRQRLLIQVASFCVSVGLVVRIVAGGCTSSFCNIALWPPYRGNKDIVFPTNLFRVEHFNQLCLVLHCTFSSVRARQSTITALQRSKSPRMLFNLSCPREQRLGDMTL
ncbi:hypothetical protein KC19_8G113300 [Ceratodon purpureus]|uniref:Uncharacterized protein n=1 Tax=Ceratodon purpureus TaxID=3225 RepID=A0A8T0H170_CERPU|nr:hypothetical protein KC19_8G113300 [Ceratodon purpureus]